MPNDLYNLREAGQPGFILSENRQTGVLNTSALGFAHDAQNDQYDLSVASIFLSLSLFCVDTANDDQLVSIQFGTFQSNVNVFTARSRPVNAIKADAQGVGVLSFSQNAILGQAFLNWTELGTLMAPLRIPSGTRVNIPLPQNYQYFLTQADLDSGIFPGVQVTIETASGGNTLATTNPILFFNEFSL